MDKVGSRLGTNDDVSYCIYGAGRGGRTPTRLPSADFESAASASSAIPAFITLPSETILFADNHFTKFRGSKVDLVT